MSLIRILREREERSAIQKELNKRWNSALVSFSLNIPGKNKQAPFAQNLFYEGKRTLNQLPFKKLETRECGLQLFICLEENPEEIKKTLTRLEDTHELGRFWDFDVFNQSLEKLSRNKLRQCFLCSEEAFHCARNKTHSSERLQRHIEKKVRAYFCRKLSNAAFEALVAEVDCTPKPGLVDKNNSGSHRDMNHALFIKSAESLKPFAYECVDRGFHFKGKNPQTFFRTLRNLGKSAEKTMLQATGGINTHKGAIFSLGLHCSALGFLLSQGKPNDPKQLSDLIKSMCGATLRKELLKAKGETAGEKIYKQFKISGIREEAAQGYPFAFFEALPFYRESLKESEVNQASIKTFLYLLTHTQDTNIIKRGGLEALALAKKQARALLDQKPFSLAAVTQMDEEFIQKNLSPGGTADLLALILFLNKSLPE